MREILAPKVENRQDACLAGPFPSAERSTRRAPSMLLLSRFLQRYARVQACASARSRVRGGECIIHDARCAVGGRV